MLYRNIHDRVEDHLNVDMFQPNRKMFALDDHDDDEEDYINFVVIDEFHEKFGPAVMDIKKQHVIGVGADGVEVFQQGRLCWLQIATKHKVYLFDILLLGARAFKNGLSMILENKHTLKVIHDCRAIAGCLIAQFGVKLTNVFDTQVADVMCFYSETGGFLPDRVSTLQEVVSLHLKVPSSQLLSLQMKSQLTKEEREMWYRRPCPAPLLKVMALSVIHLQPLRLVLLDALMFDYMALVDSYLNSSHYEPDALEHLSMETVLELPRELRQLEQIHRERQERARNHYPITERGLLARFNPQTQSPSQTSLAAGEQSKTPADSFQSATAEPPSSSQVDLCQQPPINPFKSTSGVQSVDVPASLDLQAQVSELRKQMSDVSNLSVGGGRGVLKDTGGRGRPFGNVQTALSSLPAIGRGFLLQMPPAEISQESTGDMKTPGRMDMAPSCPSVTLSQVMPQPATDATDHSKDTSGLGEDNFAPTPQCTSALLSQSFRSFRN
ncbi:piRNA biogenesis protein EXD1 isoform X2 [Anabas testudineus]|uniref:piRNA biogenesis protein EXD1 isoform X2 n=1 Tax=Anabas testudineus TaxID=64144 RepID=UPI000E45EE3E|nr:piRNA biogenesis protein EXD1 isoform X2 [Anabas testudineus]XP_026210904.1 piRNA biogenesis protein EXD1 isoform X2 [Anabas testudineus]XP_026210905.1 piRNA biogenesis protein EXD1 isoform X2 [Anabas testudineus]